MTILRRNVEELLNASNRGQLLATPTSNTINEIKRSVDAALSSYRGVSNNISLEEIRRIFTFHINRVQKVTADMSASDIAARRTIDEIVNREVAKVTLEQKNSGLSYISSIEVTRTMNNTVSKGTIRDKRRNIAGVAGGVRLF